MQQALSLAATQQLSSEPFSQEILHITQVCMAEINGHPETCCTHFICTVRVLVNCRAQKIADAMLCLLAWMRAKVQSVFDWASLTAHSFIAITENLVTCHTRLDWCSRFNRVSHLEKEAVLTRLKL